MGKGEEVRQNVGKGERGGGKKQGIRQKWKKEMGRGGEEEKDMGGKRWGGKEGEETEE